MDIELSDLGRLLAAVAGGAVVGFERELHDKPAGFRTNIMICLGAALFTLLSTRLAGEGQMGDRTRIAAQIVSGVGFLGAGAIIQFRANVIGLTTAATIWTVASIGMAFGAGEYLLGVAVTALSAGVLFGLTFAEHYIARWRTMVHLEIRMDATQAVCDEVERLVREAGVYCKSWTVTKSEGEFRALTSLVGPIEVLEHLQSELISQDHVTTLKRL